jgi:DegV family protein with EDD domain
VNTSTTAHPLVAIDGGRVSRMLRAGIHRLLADQERLNRINVFPVADGDTGTNLALTMGAVLQTLRRESVAHAGELLARIADAALDGARGNSGAILAQFFLGMGDHAATVPALNASDFAAAVGAGAAYARESLTEPREGTILTVIREFAAELERQASHGMGDFLTLIRTGLTAANTALARTTSQLEELRKSGVVDAGAQGFVDIVQGMAEHIERGVDVDPGEIELTATLDAGPSAGEERDLAHRYCTECLVSGARIDLRKLREQMGAVGSSLVIAGTERKAKIHVHTNDPTAAFRVAAGFGVVSGEKADDMHRQQHLAHSKNRRIAVVTDSVADIPDELLERYDIQVVPLRVHFGSQSYLDKVGMSPEEFVAELVRNPLAPKTSQPPAGDFRRQYEFLATHFESMLSIHVTAKASGTFNTASSAAARVRPLGKLVTLDSLNASSGLGLIVLHAAERAHAGATIDELERELPSVIARTRAYAMIGSLDYAVRGGRVPPIVRTAARLLRVAPLLATHADGRIAVGGALFGRARLPEKFLAFLLRRMGPAKRYRIGIGHAHALETGEWLQTELRQRHSGIESSFLVPLGSALSAHGGPGTVVVGIQEC